MKVSLTRLLWVVIAESIQDTSRYSSYSQKLLSSIVLAAFVLASHANQTFRIETFTPFFFF